MQLRIDEPDQSHETINWAEDFRFDTRWPPNPNERKIAHGHPSLEKSISFLEQYDLDVARTVTTDSYDLLVDTDGDPVRLAVEPGWLREGRIRFHPIANADAETLDWFLVYCDETDRGYLVSPDEFEESISLRVPETETASINRANDYEFEERWPHCTEAP